MHDPKRIPVVMKKISSIWKRNPDLRFFQLMEIIKSKIKMEDLFYFEDSDLELILETEFDSLKKTPEEWCKKHKIQIVDADGWDRTNRNWPLIPITEKEFFEKITESTCTGDLKSLKKKSSSK
jgi:hypothetical protein